MHNGILFLFLFCAHLLGDFYFQPPALAIKKEESYFGLLLHALIYMTFILLVFLFVETPWWLLLVASVSHYIIDSAKWLLRTSKLSNPMLFIIDQFLHLLTLWMLSILTPEMAIRSWLSILLPSFWPWLTLILLVWRPVNVSVDILFEKYAEAAKEEKKRQDLELAQKQKAAEMLANKATFEQPAEDLPELLEVEGAGAWVGTLERIITVLFVSMGQFAAMGLLMAAKSMARYDRISKGPAFAEYYLIGTLYSILVAIVAYLFLFKIVFPVTSVVLPTPIILMTPTPLP